MHAYATGPDLVAWIARPHGDPALTYAMNFALRTAGCPAAERNVLTEPTGGASPVLAPRGADSPRAQLCQSGRAVVLKRRRKVRDEILGRDGKPSQSPSRKGRRQTLNSGLVQPALVDASFLNESLASVSRASSATSFTKNWNYSVRFGVRPLDFRDHIEVRRSTMGLEPTKMMHAVNDLQFHDLLGVQVANQRRRT